MPHPQGKEGSPLVHLSRLENKISAAQQIAASGENTMFFIVIVAAVLIIGIVALVASQFTKDNNSETETVRYYPISQPSQPTRICGSCNRNTAGSHWELDAGMLCDCVGTSRRHAHGSPTATATATTGNTTAPGAGRTAA